MFWGQKDNFTEKRKSRFLTLIWPLGIKWKFRNLIAHLQDIPNDTLEYNLSTLWNVDRVSVTTTLPNRHFLALIWPLGPKWIFQKPYCASTRHARSDPRMPFGCDLRCRRSSSDKKLFGHTDGRTDRGKRNILS